MTEQNISANAVGLAVLHKGRGKSTGQLILRLFFLHTTMKVLPQKVQWEHGCSGSDPTPRPLSLPTVLRLLQVP